jgi:hypothetical protein
MSLLDSHQLHENSGLQSILPYLLPIYCDYGNPNCMDNIQAFWTMRRRIAEFDADIYAHCVRKMVTVVNLVSSLPEVIEFTGETLRLIRFDLLQKEGWTSVVNTILDIYILISNYNQGVPPAFTELVRYCLQKCIDCGYHRLFILAQLVTEYNTFGTFQAIALLASELKENR